MSKGSKSVPNDIRKSIQDISCLGVRNKDITAYYKLKPFSVSNLIRRTRSKAINKERGRKWKLALLGLRLFQRYAAKYCFDPLYAVVAKFSAETKMTISESTGRCYIQRMKMNC